MHPIKRTIASEIIKQVYINCCKVAHEKNVDLACLQILGIDSLLIEELLKKIIIALPDEIFYSSNPETLDAIKTYMSHEFMFFQAQENWNSDTYLLNLLGFIDMLNIEINNQLRMI